jgi:hypothetical protein
MFSVGILHTKRLEAGAAQLPKHHLHELLGMGWLEDSLNIV